MTDDDVDALGERLLTAGLGMTQMLSIYIGDRLGWYRALSLCTIVAWWNEGVQSGAFWWDSAQGTWAYEYSSVPQTMQNARF